ncbi:DUF6468 domain-containing protein [Azospirillum sp.]|uniref:DUF6468 domain-containing protein n=1 Tax=Azospirillum sp. TaxID=34012 RepID=UPI002D44FEED|nr:DUF6468 domain-containing protein [Azospirillum sp.]HYD66912.1 DUF6468 domain-containing protein [Azospirillum sp.]
MVSFLIDAVLAVMLVTATVFLVIVNKRLKVLRSGQSEINTLITTFSRTIDETDASVKRLVGAATEISAKLADELDRAKVVQEDVALILGSCERASKRIEESVQHARALVRRLEEGPARPRPVRPEATRPEPVPMAVLMPEPAPAAVADEPAEPAEPAPAAPAMAPAVAAEDDGGFRPMSPGAFYARLRTIGTGG